MLLREEFHAILKHIGLILKWDTFFSLFLVILKWKKIGFLHSKAENIFSLLRNTLKWRKPVSHQNSSECIVTLDQLFYIYI